MVRARPPRKVPRGVETEWRFKKKYRNVINPDLKVTEVPKFLKEYVYERRWGMNLLNEICTLYKFHLKNRLQVNVVNVEQGLLFYLSLLPAETSSFFCCCRLQLLLTSPLTYLRVDKIVHAFLFIYLVSNFIYKAVFSSAII